MTKRHNAKHKIDRRLGENIWGRPKSPFNKRETRRNNANPTIKKFRTTPMKSPYFMMTSSFGVAPARSTHPAARQSP